MRELRTAINRFRKPPAKSNQELINSVQIAAPCPVSWGSMSGDDKVRFCGSCEKNVYDISALTADAAVELIRENKGDMCIQLYRRTDGTVLTEDCPKGLKRLRQAMIKKVACVVAAFGWLGFAGDANAQSNAGELETAGGKGKGACKVTRGQMKISLPVEPQPAERLGGAIAVDSVPDIVPTVNTINAVKTEETECCPDRLMMRILVGLVAVGAGLASFRKLKGRPIWIVGAAAVVTCALIGFTWMM